MHAGQHLSGNELSSDGCILFCSATRCATDRHLVEAEGLQLLQAFDAAPGRADDGETIDEVVGQRAGLAGIAAEADDPAQAIDAVQRLLALGRTKEIVLVARDSSSADVRAAVDYMVGLVK